MHRYTVINTLYLIYIGLQMAKIRTKRLEDTVSPTGQMRFG